MTTNLIEEMAYGWLNLMTHSGDWECVCRHTLV